MTSFDPQRADLAPYGFTCELWRPSKMSRPDRHNEIELNLLRTGSVSYLLGGHKVCIPQLQLAAFWAALPHQIISFDAPAEYFVATLPLAWFLQCRLPEAMIHCLLQGGVVVEPEVSRGSSDLNLLSNWEKDLHEAGEGAKRIVLLELEARLLRLWRSWASANSKAPSFAKLSSQAFSNKVEQMACIIARQYTQALSVQDIAHAVGLHPNYAMGLFKKSFGITLVEYITKQRISHAQRLLATTEMKVTVVAQHSGFNSISRFNTAFLRECRCSPGTYRRQQQAGY